MKKFFALLMTLCLLMTAAASVAEEAAVASFTPSVTGKPAPEVVPTVSANNEIVVANIYLPDSTEAVKVTEQDQLVVTALSEVTEEENTETAEQLQKTYESILNEGVASLSAELPASINEQLTALGAELTHEDLVVRDLFEISLNNADKEQLLAMEGSVIELTFDMPDLDPDQPLVIVYSSDSVNWIVIPADMIVINGDGTVTVKMLGLGVVAFLVPSAEQLPAGEEAVSSPV